MSTDEISKLIGGFDSSDLFSRKEDENKIRLLRRQVDNGLNLLFNSNLINQSKINRKNQNN